MKSAQRRQTGKTALDLIEEATHLLRTGPASLLVPYGIGTVPFVLGLWYYWADMSRSPFARQHAAEASLGMALLFVWMKLWQAIFAGRVRAALTGAPPQPLTFRFVAGVLLTQTIIQPSALFLLPLAMIAALPLAWAYAFYQNATALACSRPGATADLLRHSWRQALLWPRQNHLVLTILSGFGFVLLFNWAALCLAVPHLIRMFLGIDTVFTRSGLAALNTTLLIVIAGLAFLCTDPILKVIYVLRCFYGESLRSGEDLKAELKRFGAAARTRGGALILGVILLAGLPAAAAAENDARPPTAPAERAQPGVSAAELDAAISRVIQQRKYAWRLPRESFEEQEAEQGFIARFLNQALDLIRKWAKAVLDWLVDLLRKLFRGRRLGSGSGGGYGWMIALQLGLWLLLVVAALALAWLLYRLWRGRRPALVSATEPFQPEPDLADENVGPDDLPEDRWTKLARELAERGEYRLALRAWYLASLARLAERNLITLARYKSNREYERELLRRGHSLPGLLSAFGANLAVFERIWYGLHEADGDVVAAFAQNVEDMKAAP